MVDPVVHNEAAEDGAQAVARADDFMLSELAGFIRQTREHVFLRECDHTIILRPNKLYRVNETGWEILSRLYDRANDPDPRRVAREVASEYAEEEERVLTDVCGVARTLSGLMREDLADPRHIRRVGFGKRRLEWPILSEIALTYGCQNRCRFCYANSPDRETSVPRMSPDEVDLVIDRISGEAYCPSISFTGGEPTLVKDLPRHIRHAKSRGMRVNLITNGIRCAEPGFAETLAEAGLDSAQVSLEAGSAEVHDDIVGRPGAFEATVEGVRALRRAGIHTHTNTTICGLNKERLDELVAFVAHDLESEYFSMNLVIRTGASIHDPAMDISYADLREIVPPVFDQARACGVKPVWYSPTPLCVFNPMQYGVSSTTCACCESLLSVNPSGEVLPCSSFEEGVGNIVRRSFEKVWRGPAARYWRSKAAAPPGCSECRYFALCYGACPLYWDDRGGFEEIDEARPKVTAFERGLWRIRRATRGRVFGVGHESANGRSTPRA